jgi:hypothetical protein
MSIDIPSPPGGTGIRVVQSTDDLLVVDIPPGGRGARSIGFFAFVWNLITLPLSAVMLSEEVPAVMFLFFSVFWMVGLGMAYAWLKMRFTQTLVAVKPHELTVQRKFLGRKKLSRTKLGEHSQADMDVAYQSNDQNVYRVCVSGVDRQEKFGTRLSQAEKEWLVTVLNRIICPDRGQSGSPSSRRLDYCSDCGTQLLIGEDKRVCPDCGRIYRDGDAASLPDAVDDLPAHARPIDVEPMAAVAPHELSPESPIVVEIDESEHLQFWYPNKHMLFKAVGCFLFVFSAIWLCVVAGMLFTAILAQNQKPADQATGIGIAVVFALVGLIPLGLSLGMFRARSVFDLDRKNFTVRFRAGVVKFGKSISTASIRDVGLGHMTSPMNVTPQTASPKWATPLRILAASFRGSAPERTDFEALPQPGSREAEPPRHGVSGQSPETRILNGVAKWGEKTGMVFSSEFDMPVVMPGNRQLSEDVTGLIRYQLDRMGHTFPKAG